MYHWLSTDTGEVVEDFPRLVSEVIKTVRYYRKSWGIAETVRFMTAWKYSRAGF